MRCSVSQRSQPTLKLRTFSNPKISLLLLETLINFWKYSNQVSIQYSRITMHSLMHHLFTPFFGLASFGEPVSTAASYFCSWMIEEVRDMGFCCRSPSILRFNILCFFFFFAQHGLKSGYLRNLSVSLNQIGNSPLMPVISTCTTSSSDHWMFLSYIPFCINTRDCHV